jgi:hypothetical protein
MHRGRRSHHCRSRKEATISHIEREEEPSAAATQIHLSVTFGSHRLGGSWRSPHLRYRRRYMGGGPTPPLSVTPRSHLLGEPWKSRQPPLCRSTTLAGARRRRAIEPGHCLANASGHRLAVAPSYHVMPPLGRRAGPSPGHCLLSAGTSMDRATSKIRVGEKRMGG